MKKNTLSASIKSSRIMEIWLTATALETEAGVVYAVATTERLIVPSQGE